MLHSISLNLDALTGPASLASIWSWFNWMYPPKAAADVEVVDYAFDFVNAITTIFFVGIIGLMVFFAIKYRRRGAAEHAPHSVSHNTALELGWTLPPVLIVIYMFYLGFTGFMHLTTVPENAYEVHVTARKWSWNFRHPNGAESQHLHVPAGQPIVLKLESNDVIHSVYIPSFRVKKDVVPGRYNTLWFTATEPTAHADYVVPEGATAEEAAVLEQKAVDAGHILYCTEFCGTNHSLMLAKVIVHEPGWRPEALVFDEASVDVGKQLFAIKGCVACHQINEGGPALQGPTFAGGIVGTTHEVGLPGGGRETITVDEAYLEESIRNPQAKIGPSPMMNNMILPVSPMPQIPLSDIEVESLILYIKSFSEGAEQGQ